MAEMLGEYAKRDIARFHMPGHKGRGLPPFASVGAWDVTEVNGTDDLSCPEEAILRTEQAYARAYGAKACLLLVNGSTAGIAAMLLSLGTGKRVLVSRDCHKSAASAAALGGHALFSVFPQGPVVTPAEIEAALKENAVDAVLITSPTYYGRCADLPAIAKAVHARGAKLFVDAAHGAHFPFSRLLPDFPSEDIDLWCVSAHKTLNAFTQGAVLCLGQGCALEAEELRRRLCLLQTSSPSYLIMASLDWALYSADGWDEHVKRIRAFAARADTLNGLSVERADDPTRLVINVNARGISGYEAYAALQEKNIVAEMADLNRLVLITTPSDPDEWYARLMEGLRTLPYGTKTFPARHTPIRKKIPLLSPREAMLGKVEYVPLEQAAGRISACAAGVYPPGIARLFPGEAIDPEDVAALVLAREQGAALFGLAGGRAACALI